MQTTYTSVLARRKTITADFRTLPYEAGWAREAVLFTQVEGDHPDLTIWTEVSPDGINWVRKGETSTLTSGDSITVNELSVFGNWIRVAIAGATDEHSARVLVHVNLKG